MKLSDRRWRFTKDVALLIVFIATKYPQVKAAAKELHRTPYQQERYLAAGLSDTLDSKHLNALAIDFDFYTSGIYLGDWLEDDVRGFLEPIGAYWESLTPGNRWGGRWGKPFDPWHFEAGE